MSLLGGTVASAVARAIASAAAEALQQAARPAPEVSVRAPDGRIENPVEVPGKPTLSAFERARIAEEIAAKAMQKPEVRHLASAESSPWQSRAHWAAVIAIASPVLAVFGYTVSPDAQEAVAGTLMLIGNLIAAYLAHRARTAVKPLGA
jgi:hypothetical protein